MNIAIIGLEIFHDGLKVATIDMGASLAQEMAFKDALRELVNRPDEEAVDARVEAARSRFYDYAESARNQLKDTKAMLRDAICDLETALDY